MTAVLRRPATYVYTLLLIIGAVAVALEYGPAVEAFPVAAALAIVLFGLHALVFYLLVRSLDYLEPEPFWLKLAAFLWGGLVAVAAATHANAAIFQIMTKTLAPSFVEQWAPAIAGPTSEESLKTLGIIMIVLLARKHINSVIDGVVYGALVGLGFQEVENLSYALNAVASAGTGDSVEPVLQIFLVRGFLAGLWSHTVYSGIAGAGIAYFVVRRDRSLPWRLFVAVAGFAAAWGVHFLWNSPLLNQYFGEGAGAIFGFILKGAPILLLFLFIARGAGRRERAMTGAALLNLGDPVLARPSEVKALLSPIGRLRAQWNAYVQGGPSAVRPVRALQRGQVRLARTIIEDEVSPEVDTEAVGEVLVARERLARSGVLEASGESGPHRFSGLLALLLGISGVGVLLGIPMAWWGARRARRHGTRADFWLLIGVIVGLVVLSGLIVAMAANRDSA